MRSRRSVKTGYKLVLFLFPFSKPFVIMSFEIVITFFIIRFFSFWFSPKGFTFFCSYRLFSVLFNFFSSFKFRIIFVFFFVDFLTIFTLVKSIIINMVISSSMVYLGRMTYISMRVLYTAHCTLFEDLT